MDDDEYVILSSSSLGSEYLKHENFTLLIWIRRKKVNICGREKWEMNYSGMV